MFILNCYCNSGLGLGRSLCWLAWTPRNQGGWSSAWDTTLWSPGFYLPLHCQQFLWPLPAVKRPHQCCNGTDKSSSQLVSVQARQQPCQGAERYWLTADGSTSSPVPRTTVIAYNRLFGHGYTKTWNPARFPWFIAMFLQAPYMKGKGGRLRHTTRQK